MTADYAKPPDMTSIEIFTGTPSQSASHTFTTVTQVRVLDSGDLAAMASDGSTVIYVRADAYWAFRWQ